MIEIPLLINVLYFSRFLGAEHLSPVKHSLLAILKTASHQARKSVRFHAVSAALWEAFVMTVSLDDLSVILPQVRVYILNKIIL